MSAEMLETLRELNGYLWSYGHLGQARIVSKLLYLHGSDRPAFVSLLQSGEVWGGAGAVWEVGGLGGDDQAFRAAIIRLAEAMDREGVGTTRSQSIADTLREWRCQGI